MEVRGGKMEVNGGQGKEGNGGQVNGELQC